MKTTEDIAVIGGGPAGLKAAEAAASNGCSVTVYEAKRSVGRKFLVAGKSGLNLTHHETFAKFLKSYQGDHLPAELWETILTRFDSSAIRAWASGLGIETFVASSGKVFPIPVDGVIRAAPLLRRWVERLRASGVQFRAGHRWSGFCEDSGLEFQHQDTLVVSRPKATVLALGGASWPQTGSDGKWTSLFSNLGISLSPWEAANCGWEVDWPEALLKEAEGAPLKNILLKSESASKRGELVITNYGLEGGPLYRLGPTLRRQESPVVIIDFKPDLSHEELVRRLGRVKRNFVREARRRWKLDPGTAALLKFLPERGPWRSAEQLAREVKHCKIALLQPRPIAEAISSAGGISWSEVDSSLMLRKKPGLFVAGEMLDWEAPTGGYLLQGCFATGDYAGTSAAQWVHEKMKRNVS